MCRLNQAEWKALDATDPRPGREKGEGEAIEANICFRETEREVREEKRSPMER